MAQLFSLGIMAALLTALIMAAISALAFIAYRHPKAYSRMYWSLCLISLGCLILGGPGLHCYALGFKDASSDYVDLNNGEILKHPHSFGIPFWASCIPVLFMIYLQVLKYLPSILDLHGDDKDKDIPKDKMNEKGLDDDA